MNGYCIWLDQKMRSSFLCVLETDRSFSCRKVQLFIKAIRQNTMIVSSSPCAVVTCIKTVESAFSVYRRLHTYKGTTLSSNCQLFNESLNSEKLVRLSFCGTLLAYSSSSFRATGTPQAELIQTLKINRIKLNKIIEFFDISGAWISTMFKWGVRNLSWFVS